MGKTKTLRLSVMMFLQYAVWGAWLPIAAMYLESSVSAGGLGFDKNQIGWILGLAASIGAVCSPFIAGQFADRYFPAQRFLALLLLIGGVVQIVLARQTTYPAWLTLAILYSIVYMPTLALSNSVAFAHMTNQEKQFPIVRVWGTIGWIAASWAFPMIWLQSNLSLQWMPPFLSGPELPNATARLANALKFSGFISIAYAVFAFLLLPNTPPKKEGVAKLAFAKAFALFKKPSFTVLFLASLPISMIHQIYFLQTSPFFRQIGLPASSVGPAMTIAQVFEIAVMALLGLMLTRIGFKRVILIGMLAYAVRYVIFANVTLPVPVIVTSQFLHGFCYACFFAGGFIYVDRIAPADIRHTAQTLYGIFILGIGPVLGGRLLGLLGHAFRDRPDLGQFQGIWYTLAAIAAVTALLFLLLFRSQVAPQETPKAALSKPASEELAETIR